MKFIRILVFSLFVMPMASFAGGGDFMLAAQLLAAAKSADIQQVQALVNNGADVNYVDATGLSIVCTALMNNDVRAEQILQMYGADASNCDRQIKQYNNSNYYWWLRSANSSYTGSFFYVSIIGAWSDYYSNDTRGVSPAFRIT